MNLILFEPGELDRALPLDDPRAVHLLAVLKRRVGEPFDLGVVDGPRGKGWITERDDCSLSLGYRLDPDEAAAAPSPVSLIVGLARPQTMRRILRDATTLGVGELLFAATERGEASYRASSLWSSGEYRRHLVDGAAQAFDTRLPAARLFDSLAECLASLAPQSARLALDNYEASLPLAGWRAPHHPNASPSEPPPPSPRSNSADRASGPRVYLAVGSERGWTAAERELLRASGFLLVHLGKRVLRAESACVAGLTLVLARLDRLQ